MEGNTNPVLLAGALQSEVKEGRKREVIDMYLVKIQHLVTQSRKAANKLITAGIVHTIIHLLKIRASDGEGLEVVLMTLGILAYVHFFPTKSYLRVQVMLTIQRAQVRSYQREYDLSNQHNNYTHRNLQFVAHG